MCISDETNCSFYEQKDDQALRGTAIHHEHNAGILRIYGKFASWYRQERTRKRAGHDNSRLALIEIL
jgi:hypothetical protein